MANFGEVPVYLVVRVAQLVDGRNDVLRQTAQYQIAYLAVANFCSCTNDVFKKVLNVAYLVRERSICTHFYGQVILLVNKLYGRRGTPLLVRYLRLAIEIDVQLVFAFEVLAKVYKCGEEGVVVGLEVKGSFFRQYVYHFAFVNQHCALSWANYQFAGVLYLVGFSGIFVPQVLLFISLPLNYGRQLIAKKIGYAHNVCIYYNV